MLFIVLLRETVDKSKNTIIIEFYLEGDIIEGWNGNEKKINTIIFALL